MRTLQISRDIIPLARFKSQASQIFRQLREDDRPVVVTQHGQPAAVLITPEEFDRLQEHDRFLSALHEGLEDSEMGRIVADADLVAELDAEFGT
jgi:prevent-host-death family protein